jgi:hypothetical protein
MSLHSDTCYHVDMSLHSGSISYIHVTPLGHMLSYRHVTPLGKHIIYTCHSTQTHVIMLNKVTRAPSDILIGQTRSANSSHGLPKYLMIHLPFCSINVTYVSEWSDMTPLGHMLSYCIYIFLFRTVKSCVIIVVCHVQHFLLTSIFNSTPF